MPISTPDGSEMQYLDAAQALENVGDEDALREILTMMVELLNSDVAQISQCMEQGDFPAAQRMLHAFKGCVPIFCPPALCEELTTIEQMAKSADAKASAPLYTVLRPKLEILRDEIAQYLASTAA